jgi:hypothetical protein
MRISLEAELHRRASRRASDLGLSLAEYVRRLVARDLAAAQIAVDVSCVYDLGSPGNADIARNKDDMLAAAFRASRE